MFIFWFKFQRSLIPMMPLTTNHQWLRLGLAVYSVARHDPMQWWPNLLTHVCVIRPQRDLVKVFYISHDFYSIFCVPSSWWIYFAMQNQTSFYILRVCWTWICGIKSGRWSRIIGFEIVVSEKQVRVQSSNNLFYQFTFQDFARVPAVNRQISQIPLWTCPESHNAPLRKEVCTFLLQNDSLWDTCLMHCGMCGIGLWVM